MSYSQRWQLYLNLGHCDNVNGDIANRKHLPVYYSLTYLLFTEHWAVMHSAVSSQIVCVEFEDTTVHIISELEPYYSLLLLRISAQENRTYHYQDNVY